MQSLSQDQFILITLLIQLGVIAAISTILVRFDTFKRMLFNEELGWKRRIYLTALVGSIFAVGVLARLTVNYQAADLAISAALLVGILAGPTAGVGVGIIVGIWPIFFGQYLSLPFAILCGYLGGTVFLLEKSLKDRMDFSPFSILKIHQYLKKIFIEKKLSVQLLIIGYCVFISFLSMWLVGKYEGLIYGLNSSSIIVKACIVASVFACVGIPLKIWNNTRVELLLIEKEKGLTKARLEAIKSKLEPHFLFNTLNAIFSSIRKDPDKARSIVLRLSEVLRFVLDAKGEFTKLSQEIDLIESYLSIEEARFGHGRVKFEKEVEEELNSSYIPTMLLQPVVENSIKHGISKKVDSGKITLKASREENNLKIVISDDGAGIKQSKLKTIKREGIGLSSIDERLKTLYQENFTFGILSEEGKGTEVQITIPIRDNPGEY